MKRSSLLLAFTALALSACHGSSTPDAGGSNGPGSECTSNADCQSGICLLPDANTPIGFCSEPCKHVGDCFKDYLGGCCVPTQSGEVVCAIAALCNDTGDAGLGDPCPTGGECGAGLLCLSDSTGAVTECSQVCQTNADCAGASQVCCEDLSGGVGNPELLCVLDPACGPQGDGGPTYDAGPPGPGGDDGGPFYAAYYVDGTLVADTTAYLGSVGPSSDLLFAPPLGRNLEIDLHPDAPLGTFACDGGGSPAPDGGSIFAVATTNTTNSTNFATLLPGTWQNLTLPFLCGPGVVPDDDSLSVRAASITITAYTPGRVLSADAGSLPGHLTGSAYWQVGPTDGGYDDAGFPLRNSLLEIRERFDVPLTPP
ncbi:MAG: hypothetical protein JST54_23250 [Deltaproteobacteria bacterium]|nr:hypothetical protein [Deltaproteobacteria bacterium]